MADKQTTVEEIVGELSSGMTLGIGGWGSRRKPMAVIRAICRSDLENLTVVSYGGPDVGLLCAAGKVAKVICGFVTLDSIPLDPHWRKARQSGAVDVVEFDEGMFYLGLQAASWRLPFLPTRAGLGSDVLTHNRDTQGLIGSLRRPFDKAGELVQERRFHLIFIGGLRPQVTTGANHEHQHQDRRNHRLPGRRPNGLRCRATPCLLA